MKVLYFGQVKEFDSIVCLQYLHELTETFQPGWLLRVRTGNFEESLQIEHVVPIAEEPNPHITVFQTSDET